MSLIRSPHLHATRVLHICTQHTWHTVAHCIVSVFKDSADNTESFSTHFDDGPLRATASMRLGSPGIRSNQTLGGSISNGLHGPFLDELI